jgi:hypothetical protein
LKGFNLQIFKEITGIVGGFSVLNVRSKLFKNNRWRESNYLSIWGWACSSEVWKNYNLNIDSDLIVNQLTRSTTWLNFPNFRKMFGLVDLEKLPRIQARRGTFNFNFSPL